MGALLRRRVWESGLSLVLLVMAVFVLIRMTGNPANLYLPLNATEEMREDFTRRHGFDLPLYEQLWIFLGDVARLDLGDSLRRGRPAFDVVLEAYPATLALAGITLLVAFIVAIILGSLAALSPNSIVDRLATTIAVGGASIPTFWAAIMAIMIFSILLGWLPTSGTETPLHWILPVAVLMTRPCGAVTQVVRGSLVQILSAPYIQAAKARGAGTSSILFGHGLRNASIPAITVLGESAVGILNGAVVVEVIFGWPGIGKLLLDSILSRDFAVVQASIIFIAAAIFILNIVIELLYGLIDPRVRI